jgi:hypothetical protein
MGLESLQKLSFELEIQSGKLIYSKDIEKLVAEIKKEIFKIKQSEAWP